MAKPPPVFDKTEVRQDSQLIPVPRVSVPMPKAAPAKASQSPVVNPSNSQKTDTKPPPGSGR